MKTKILIMLWIVTSTALTHQAKAQSKEEKSLAITIAQLLLHPACKDAVSFLNGIPNYVQDIKRIDKNSEETIYLINAKNDDEWNSVSTIKITVGMPELGADGRSVQNIKCLGLRSQ